MVTLSTIAILVVASAASLFTAWTIGGGSSGSTPFAPAVSAGAIPTMRAAFVVGILGFAGAVLQGAAVAHTVGEGLIGGVTLTPVAVTIALVVGAGLIAIGIFTGYPIATTFAITGAVIGVGLALGGTPVWNEYQAIAALWILTPFVGASAAYALSRLLRGERIAERVLLPLLGGIVALVIANMRFGFLGTPTGAASVAEVIAVRLPGPALAWQAVVSLAFALVLAGWLVRAVSRDVDATRRRFLLALGALVAFSAGGGKVGLAVGPLLPLLESVPFSVPIVVVLAGGGFGLLLGSWMVAPRMIKALTQDYSELGPRRSIAVLVPAFAIAQVSIFYGLPMSFNEIFISAIVGSGYAAGRESVSPAKTGYTALAWAGSLVIGFGVSYGAYEAIAAFL